MLRDCLIQIFADKTQNVIALFLLSIIQREQPELNWLQISAKYSQNSKKWCISIGTHLKTKCKCQKI